MATEKRVNHAAAVREIEAKFRATGEMSPEDAAYLLERHDALKRQLDDERDAAALA